MSVFNGANDLAERVVYGRQYQGGEPCPRPDGITERDGTLYGVLKVGTATIDVNDRPVNHETWVAVAQSVQAILHEQHFSEVRNGQN
jgi:hypothetical protein